MSDKIIVLSDRIKEISHDTGAGNLKIDGAATGFSAFADFYNDGDAIYYAITDGVQYEVGSGQYIEDSHNYITRFPFDTSKPSDAIVSWEEGVKEVFVTYPGKYSVFTASGLGTHQEPAMSGLAFWGSRQILDYNSNLVWNTADSKLGILTNNPQYTIDIGGAEADSIIRSSGMIVGDSGVMFSGVVASGGRQIEPFLRSQLDNTTGTDAVFALSGLVDERLLFQKQVKGSVFTGPASGCVGDCSPEYPTFRYLVLEDIPDLSTLYTKEYYEAAITGNVLFYKDSGVYHTDPYFTWDKTNNRLGLSTNTPTRTLDVWGSAGISGTLDASGDAIFGGDVMINENLTTSGTLNVSGDATFDGNMTIRGTLDAHVADFKVTADTMTFGDTSADNVIFNASTADVPNDLTFNGGDIHVSGNLGVGTESPGEKVDVSLTGVNGGIRVINSTDNAYLKLDAPTDEAVYIDFSTSESNDWQIGRRPGSNDLTVFDNDGANDYVFTWQQGGNVGIGTTTPEEKLHVAGNTALVGDTLASGDVHVSGQIGIGVASEASYGLVLANSGQGLHTSRMKIIGQQTSGPGSEPAARALLEFETNDARAAGIIINRNETGAGLVPAGSGWFIGAPYGRTNWFTIGHSDDNLETHWNNSVIKIGIGDKVGIGQADSNWIPQATLHVSGDALFDKDLTIIGDTLASGDVYVSGNIDVNITNANGGIRVINDTDNAYVKLDAPSDEAAYIDFSTGANNDWQIGRRPSSNDLTVFDNDGASDYIFTWQQGGNVGIGTTTPDSKLHVAGSVGIVGNTVASGTLGVSGVTTLHGGLETYSGGLPAHTVINASGFLTIPVYATTAAVEAALPASEHNSGVIAVGGNSFMVCNGYSWFTDNFS